MAINVDKGLACLAVIGCGWLLVDALRTGKAGVPAPMTNVDYSRTDDPFGYWITVSVLVLAEIVAVNWLVTLF